jgi:hypothetical protein
MVIRQTGSTAPTGTIGIEAAAAGGGDATNDITAAWSPSSTVWGAVQVLAGHPDPKSGLVLGVGEAYGLCGRVTILPSTRVDAGDAGGLADGEPLLAEAGWYPDTGPELDARVTDRFDIVYLTQQWLSMGVRSGRSLSELVADGVEWLSDSGRLVIHFNLGPWKVLNRIGMRVLSGQPVPALEDDQPWWRMSSVQKIVEAAGLRLQARYYAKGLKRTDTITQAICEELGANEFARRTLGEERRFVPSVRRSVLRRWFTSGWPLDHAFPMGIIVARRPDARRSDSIGSPLWMKRTGRVVTSIERHVGPSYFVRSGPRHSVLKEAELLRYLDGFDELKWWINPPIDIRGYGTLHRARYGYLSGFAMFGNRPEAIAPAILDFLIRLSRVPPPEFLDPGVARLRKYLLKEIDSGRADPPTRALNRLDHLEGRGVFRWVTHGELGAHNIRIVDDPCGSRITVVDWPQSYSGHPLIDWWMFRYWGGAPPGRLETPIQLTMGLTESQLDDLWLVWRSAYRIRGKRSPKSRE